MDNPRERYHQDPQFRMAVDVIQSMLEKSMLTTEDVAQAAVLASQLYAERHHAPIILVMEKGEDHKR